MNKNIPEDKILFRLVKVIYFLALLVGILIVVLLSWSEKPTSYVDGIKSSITCSNGKKYMFSTVGLYPLSSESILDRYDIEKASKFCMENYEYGFVRNNNPDKVEKSTYSQLQYYGLDISGYPDANKFTYSMVRSTRGGWDKVILWSFGGILGVYIILNIIRETLNYVFFGLSFTLDWLVKIIDIFK